jgi:hypothetical protein
MISWPFFIMGIFAGICVSCLVMLIYLVIAARRP